jgi:hypothetical protein
MIALAPILLAGSVAGSAPPADGLFEPPFRVRDGGAFIDVEIGHAAPLYVDFDGDGVNDLLVGQFGEGKLRVYKNAGTNNEPRFEGFTWFKTGEEEGKIPAG